MNPHPHRDNAPLIEALGRLDRAECQADQWRWAAQNAARRVDSECRRAHRAECSVIILATLLVFAALLVAMFWGRASRAEHERDDASRRMIESVNHYVDSIGHLCTCPEKP